MTYLYISYFVEYTSSRLPATAFIGQRTEDYSTSV